MAKWEYKVVDLRDVAGRKSGAIDATLRRFGEDGWERVSTPHADSVVYSLFFKRPIPT